MLILSRKKHQTIRLTVPASTTEQTIELDVTETGPKAAAIGIQCDEKIKILRGEVIDRDEANHVLDELLTRREQADRPPAVGSTSLAELLQRRSA